MDAIKSYKDLCGEIEIWKERLKTYEEQRKAIKKLGKLDGPSDISGIDYTQPYVNGTSQISFETALEMLGKIDSHIYLHEETIGRLEESRKEIRNRIKKLEGLDKKVVFMRNIERKKLSDIAKELGYTYQYIKEVSARNKTTY